MADYKHILLAVDFSPENRKVIGKAQELARKDGAEITLIHVVEYTSAMYAGDIPLPEDLALDQRLAEQAADKLAALAKEYGMESAERRVEIGVPKREIVRVAQEIGADLICIGSHGRHGLQLLLGSTANGVLHMAKCDVLAVRVGEAA
ncbi:MAG TPA: universal stress protein [Sedimenticola sp.]|nr:universal stress protein [Sedimenticola sp.]